MPSPPRTDKGFGLLQLAPEKLRAFLGRCRLLATLSRLAVRAEAKNRNLALWLEELNSARSQALVYLRRKLGQGDPFQDLCRKGVGEELPGLGLGNAAALQIEDFFSL